MIEEIKVLSVLDLINKIGVLQKRTPSMLWFRGQQEASWDISPSVFRDDHRYQERNYVHRFRSRGYDTVCEFTQSTESLLFG